MAFLMLIALASTLAGGIASVAGFGIGSILTPLFNLRGDLKLAVAAVSIPHVTVTAVRFWRLRGNLDRRVLKTFGLMSAVGGLVGALLQQYITLTGVTIIFALLLTFAGVAGLTGLSERMRFGRAAGWAVGAVSGVLGGLVGNQGGIRSAGLLGYDVSPTAFVATATAVALIVDGARMPVYVWTEGARLQHLSGLIAVATAGGVVGTIAGEQLLRRIPPQLFRKLVAALLLTLGLYMFSRA